MPPIALPIEIVHLEPPSSGHLSTLDNGQPACPKGQQSVQNNLQKQTETKTTSINHKNTIKFLTFVTQIRVSSRGNHFGGEAPGSGCGFMYFSIQLSQILGGGGGGGGGSFPPCPPSG